MFFKDNLFRSPFLCITCFLILSFFQSCQKMDNPGTQENKLAMNQTEQLQCEPINRSASDLNQDCLLEIMTRLPLKEVFAVLSPSNPILQRIIKKRTEGIWPSWFIDEISKEPPNGQSDAQLVKSYLAFLKVISRLDALSQQSHAIKKKAIEDILPISLLAPESKAKNDRIYVGLIGTQVVAHFNLDKKVLSVIDLQSGKTLVSNKFPVIANTYQIMNRIMFEKLGPKSFLMTVQYQSNTLQIQEHLTIWSWEHSPDLKLIKTWPSIPMNAEINSGRKTVFRVTDTSFATFRRGIQTGDKIIDLWDIGADAPTHSTTISSCFSLDYTVEKSLNTSQDKECLEKLAHQGISIASDSFSLESGWGFGHKIDEKMLMVPEWDQLSIRSLDYKVRSTLLKAYCGEFAQNIGSIRFMTKNGDLIFKMKPGYGYTNLWKIVKQELQKSQ